MLRVVGSTIAVVCGVVVCLAAAVASAGPGEVTIDLPDQHIYGGENSLTCAWPTAVEMGGCTGTLVHPEVVIYAGHCGGNVGQVRFGETSGSGRSVGTQFCRTKPGWQPGAGTDFAVCKLSEPVTDVQVVPILMGCETDILTSGREVVLVGFGQTETGGSGVKKEVVTTLDHIANQEAWLGANGLAPCYGDSGGPAYVKLPASEGFDDTWRVFGVTSHGDQVCGSGGYYGMMHNAVAWVETETGVDVTPCHDADGTWNPTMQCQGFPMDPGGSSGSWDSWCDPVAIGGASETCGDASMEIPTDEDPPTVRIEAPVDGDDFDLGTEIEILVTALDVGDGVADVVVEIDGTALPADASAPYAFATTLAEGAHTITAVATDLAGNASLPDSVTIHVGEGGDDGMGDGGGDDAGDGGAEDAGEDGGDDGVIDPNVDPALPANFGLAGEAGGCACRSAKAGPWGWLWLLTPLAGWRRRRH